MDAETTPHLTHAGLNGELKRTARAPYPRYDRQHDWVNWSPVWQWAYNPEFCRPLWREISRADCSVARSYRPRILLHAYTALAVMHNRKTSGKKKEERFTSFVPFDRDMLAAMCWLTRGAATDVFNILLRSGVIEVDPQDRTGMRFRPRLMSQSAPALLRYLQVHGTFPKLDWWRQETGETKKNETTKITNQTEPTAPELEVVVRGPSGECPGCGESWEVTGDNSQLYPTHTGRVRLCSECHSQCETREGPCWICKEPLPAEVQEAIRAKRAEGYAVMWSHFSVVGLGCE